MQVNGKFYLKMEFQKDMRINFIFSSSESWSDIVHLSNNSHRLFGPKFHVMMIRLDTFYFGKYSDNLVQYMDENEMKSHNIQLK